MYICLGLQYLLAHCKITKLVASSVRFDTMAATSGSHNRSAFADYVQHGAGTAAGPTFNEFEQAAADAHTEMPIPASAVGSTGREFGL